MKAILDTLVGIQNFVNDVGDLLEFVELNPIMVLPEGQGVFVLDAAVVLLDAKV